MHLLEVSSPDYNTSLRSNGVKYVWFLNLTLNTLNQIFDCNKAHVTGSRTNLDVHARFPFTAQINFNLKFIYDNVDILIVFKIIEMKYVLQNI